MGALAVFSGCGAAPIEGNSACVRRHCYSIEVASDAEQWMVGLMNREHLDKNKGMLFIFPYSAKHSFWMKNTLIPLDMIWLDHTRQVVHIAANVPPCPQDPCPRYLPDQEAIYVLEMNAGEAQRIGLREGDRVDIRLLKEE